MDQQLDKAIRLASLLHKNDEYGEYPYTVHLALVAAHARIDGGTQAEIISWLHDTIEDHPEYEEIIKKEFPEEYPTIKTLSRQQNETYEEYSSRVAESNNHIALIVKKADLTVNLTGNTKEKLINRYNKSLAKINEKLNAVG